MPRDLNASAQMCCSALSNINIRPVIIIVDAVNQVSPVTVCEIYFLMEQKSVM